MALAGHRTTSLLRRFGDGDRSVQDELSRLVYAELHRLAERQLAGQPPGHTLQPTALVHEAWLRLVDQAGASFERKRDFFAFAGRAMRSVLVDHARRRGARKRGGERGRVPLEAVDQLARDRPAEADLLAVDEALTRLQGVDPELVRIVELRFFGGLSCAEVAEVTGAGLRTVERRWRLARAWLHTELSR